MNKKPSSWERGAPKTIYMRPSTQANLERLRIAWEARSISEVIGVLASLAVAKLKLKVKR